MPRAGLSRDAVVARASEMLDDAGSGPLQLQALAESLGVRVPSLYKHVDGMPGLQRGILLRGKAELAAELSRAAVGRSGADAVTRIAHAYRAWALAHPGRYALAMRAPAPDDAEDGAASEALARVVYDALAGYDLRDDDLVDATRFLRSAMHGFVALETGGAFALAADRERSWERLVASVVAALEGWRRA
ncbi:TetR/AcrR family transcriptional regulator [Clavibacter tessellarius]|uniref:TetR/AcrR family transcriptional regulator n=1 Tax=Clavibacter tessellarius TaxID=31965 RepID=UPI0039E7869B